jgi:cytoplasmic iron level regulating protein YaaA (DUF328/UPF0246 family)
VTRRLFVLLPPSESKENGGTRVRKDGAFDEVLRAPRLVVVEALAALLTTGPPDDIEKTLQVHGALLERAISASRSLVEERARYLPAWRRYNGVVWSHLDPATLGLGHRRRILVPSGLYGVTTANDVVADYRLKMNVGFTPIGGLATFWRPWLTSALADYCAGATVVNLLPGEHASAIKMAALAKVCGVVEVRFVSAGENAVAGHEAKSVKGVLARQLLLEGMGVLESFSWQGWSTKFEEGRQALSLRSGGQEVTVTFEGKLDLRS